MNEFRTVIRFVKFKRMHSRYSEDSCLSDKGVPHCVEGNGWDKEGSKSGVMQLLCGVGNGCDNECVMPLFCRFDDDVEFLYWRLLRFCL